MSALFQRQWLLPLGVLIGYALLIGTNPVRHCLIDGLRALRRYHRLWVIPAALGLGYALFRAALSFFFMFALAMTDAQAEPFGWKFTWRIPPWISLTGQAHTFGDWINAFGADPHWHLIRDGCLAGLESVAGLFNCVITTFPFSAVAAVMLFCNWENHHRTLRASLRKRFGRWAWAVHGGILLCALSAIVAPILYGPSLLYLNRVAPGLLIVRWASVIDWLSWLFSYLFGVGVQVYLILVVYTWLRGISWTSAHLMDLAIRRCICCEMGRRGHGLQLAAHRSAAHRGHAFPVQRSLVSRSHFDLHRLGGAAVARHPHHFFLHHADHAHVSQ